MPSFTGRQMRKETACMPIQPVRQLYDFCVPAVCLLERPAKVAELKVAQCLPEVPGSYVLDIVGLVQNQDRRVRQDPANFISFQGEIRKNKVYWVGSRD